MSPRAICPGDVNEGCFPFPWRWLSNWANISIQFNTGRLLLMQFHPLCHQRLDLLQLAEWRRWILEIKRLLLLMRRIMAGLRWREVINMDPETRSGRISLWSTANHSESVSIAMQNTIYIYQSADYPITTHALEPRMWHWMHSECLEGGGIRFHMHAWVGGSGLVALLGLPVSLVGFPLPVNADGNARSQETWSVFRLMVPSQVQCSLLHLPRHQCSGMIKWKDLLL